MALPAATDFTGSSVTEAQFKTAMTSLLTELGSSAFTGVEAATPSTTAKRDSSGDVSARTFRSSLGVDGAVTGAMAFRVNTTTDNYLRFCSDAAAIRAFLGVDTTLAAGSLVYLCDMTETVKAALTVNSYGAGLAALSSEGAIAAWLGAHQGNAKAIKVAHSGTVTASFATKNSSSTSYVRLLKNGTQVQEWSVTTTYATKTVNVAVTKGDALLIQVKDDDNISGYVKDFQLLVAALPA